MHEYDKPRGNVQRDFIALVPRQQVEAEIDSCCDAGGRVEAAVLNIQPVGFDTGGRAQRGERVRVVPVSGDLSPIQQTGAGQNEGATANRAEASCLLTCALEPRIDLVIKFLMNQSRAACDKQQ